MKALDIACDIAKVFEGFRSKPYLCPAGVPTIGYGTTFYPEGEKVRLTDRPVTEAEALEYLEHEMYHCLKKSIQLCPILAMNDNRLGAVTDFCYNLGCGRLQQSTLRRKINKEDWDGARRELLKWNKAGGRVLKGLQRRREMEATLF